MMSTNIECRAYACETGIAQRGQEVQVTQPLEPTRDDQFDTMSLGAWLPGSPGAPEC